MAWRMEPVQKQSVFHLEGYCVWDPSIVADDAGNYHLFFSRWPIEHGFEAWVTHSEVCRASADSLFGPYHFEQVIFPKRPGFWDGDVTHNPTVKRFGNRYALYYNGNHGEGPWWDHRNNQRVGLATADHPKGPWTRRDTPLVDVTPGSWDAMVTTNPSCDRTPDGRFILVYKAVGAERPGPFYGPVVHGVAFADAFDGPFTKMPDPIFTTDDDFPGEDPFIWGQDGCFYALLKDNAGHYSSASKAIVVFDSADGMHWRPIESPVFTDRNVTFADGSCKEIYRLERPNLYVENGTPRAFLCAAKPDEASHHSEIYAMAVSQA